MTDTEVALTLAYCALEISDDCAIAGEIDEAHDAACAARVFAALAQARGGAGQWLARRLVDYSREAMRFASACALG